MVLHTEFEQAKIQYKRDTGKSYQAALLGGYTNAGLAIIDEPTLPGHVWVRYPQADGQLSQSFLVPYESTAQKVFGQPIRLGYNVYGQLCVVNPDTLGQNFQGTNTLSNNANDPNVSYYVVQQRITTANSHPISSAAASMLVTIQNWLWIEARTVNYFLGGDGGGSDAIDLTAYIPGSTGTQCAACLFVKSDNTVEVITSTPKPISINLDIADLQECVTASSVGSKPIWSWRLYNGQVGITPGNINAGGDDFMDLRQLINVSDGGASSSLTITDGITTVTDVTDITLGTGLTLTDLGGGAAQIDATGGSSDLPIRATCFFDEALSYKADNSANALTYQYDGLQFYVNYLFQTSPADGDYFTTSFVMAAGTYTAYVLGVSAVNRGKLDISLDSVNQVTGQDWYSIGTTNNVVKTFTLTVLTDGLHVLKGTINGQNGSSTNFYFAITKIWVTPSTD